MDAKKKSEASWEEVEKLGPYQLREQIPQDQHSQGELYLATHEASGATALVFKPTAEAENGAKPLTDCRVRCISSASHDYFAMEIEQSPYSVAPDKHSTETLECTFEDVREAVGRVARAFTADNEPRLRLRLGLALASAVAVWALAFFMVRMAPVSQPPIGAEPLARATPSPVSDEVPTDTELLPGMSLMDAEDGGLLVLARPVPLKPYKGQKRPPCNLRIEVEINGGCWVPHARKAPCPDELHEYQGQCYTIAVTAQPPPQALGP